MYFHKVTPDVAASLSSPSTISTSPASPGTARLTPRLPLPTQHENEKDEDLYDDPLSLNEQ